MPLLIVKMAKKTLHDLIAAAAFLALGIFWLIKSYSIKVSASAASFGTTPRTVPQIISVLVILVAFLLMAETLIKGIKLKREREKEPNTEEIIVKESAMRFVCVAVLVVSALLYCIFVEKLTYLPASILLMAVAGWCFEIKKPLPLLLLSVITPTVLFVVFRYLLSVPLP